MKKNLIITLVAAAAMMVSCSKEMDMDPGFGEFEKQAAVSFSAYNSANILSRGTVTTVEGFKTKGIGVFAFYQPAVNGIEAAKFTTAKYPTPNFMYNQQVTMTASGEAGKWTYTPIKYWPNNRNDKLSFFAYAPYEPNMAWEELGFNTDGTGNTMTKTFAISSEVKDQKDYLFAKPVTDKMKPGTISQDGLGTGVVSNYASSDATAGDDVIRFDFKHVLSKLNLYIGVNVDDTNLISASADASGNAFAWNDPDTKIEIKSIEFKDLAETYTWTSNATPDEWKAEGKQNIKVIPSSADNANEIAAATWSTAKWHRVLDGTGEGTTATDEYMFIAPQDVENNKIVITYVVKTDGGELNSSEITNVITKKWSDFQNHNLNTLEGGKQYRLFFIIGMQSVKLAATVTDWEDASNPEDIIYLPAANENPALGE